VVLSEYGPDLSRFPTGKQFVSHVTLAPKTSPNRPSDQLPRPNCLRYRGAGTLPAAAEKAAQTAQNEVL
jgi:hypothetical protein